MLDEEEDEEIISFLQECKSVLGLSEGLKDEAESVQDEKPSAPQSELIPFEHAEIDEYGNEKFRETVSTIQGYPIWEWMEDDDEYTFVGYSMGNNLILDEKWKLEVM